MDACDSCLPPNKDGLLEHGDTHANDNALTRGQRVCVDISEEDAVSICLLPGEMSLHHGHLLRASASKRSDKRRFGFSVVYAASSVRQTLAPKDYTMFVRGRDNFKNFIQVPPPEEDLSETAKQRRMRVLDIQNEVH